MKIITFYSDNLYLQAAKELQLSASKFNYHVQIVKLNDSGSWGVNLLRRTKAIEHYLQKYKCPILFLDADTLIKRPLDKLFKIINGNDLSIRVRTIGNKFNNGVMGFRYNKRVLAGINSWVNLTRRTLGQNTTVDQLSLIDIATRFRFKVANIGPKFNLLPSDVELNREDAYIIHYKLGKTHGKARAWRKKVNDKINGKIK